MRLDAALVARGLARSRGHARDLIGHGVVRVGDVVAVKGSRPVREDEIVVVDAGPGVLDPSWVSRAAGKLIAALEELPGGGPGIMGTRAADVGACTGGFTQVLLRRGASSVVAIDVGHDQLASGLRDDPRVVDLSGRNIRELTASDIGGVVDLLVADVSFISLTLIMGRLSALVRPGGDLVLLVKPQFEVGREHIGRGGIVTDEAAITRATAEVVAFMQAQGWERVAETPSPISGGDGNRETVAVFRRKADGAA